MHTIQRPALGQVASLGTFYDARTDTFVPIPLVRVSDVPAGAVDITDKHTTSFDYSDCDSFKEKFTNMNLNSELKASFLAGLITVRGSGGYLLEESRHASSVQKVSMHHRITTVHERLNLIHSDLRDTLASRTIDGSFGTHIVTEILWGAHTVISASYDTSDHGLDGWAEADVKTAFWAMLKSLGADISVEVGHSYRPDERETNRRLKIEIRAHNDVLPADRLPTTFGAVSKFLVKLPRYIQSTNGGKGFPCTYTLLPLSFLRLLYTVEIQAEIVLVQPGVDTLERFVRLFDDFRRVMILLLDYYSCLTDYRNCISDAHIGDISDLQTMAKAREGELRARFGEILQGIRCGRMRIDSLATLFDEFSNGNISPVSIVEATEQYAAKIKFFERMASKGAKYIGYLSDKDYLNNVQGEVYRFCFNWDTQHELPLFTENYAILEDLLQENETRQDATIIIKDCDGTGEKVLKPYISYERNSVVLVPDMAEERRDLGDKCIMRYKPQLFEIGFKKRPIKTARVRVPCPRPNCTPNPAQEWTCGKCRTAVSFGYNDKFLYCHCGRGLYSQWSFRCNNPLHGDEWVEYGEDKLLSLLQSLEPFECLNILFLGETGVGKSTFMNAFVNYLSYETLEEAMEAKSLNCIIPFTFATQYANAQGEFVQTTINAGSSPNELDGSRGQSATQKTSVHVVEIGNYTVRLFDTPGIGDTRGTQQDAANMADILAVLANYDKMHGIVILLKPNNSRLTVTFRWCIEELLTHLHRDAIHNIVFGFTNTRGSNYTPGDTFQPLKTELSKHKHVHMGLTQDTVYCFDSESFRYLAAYHQGVPLGDRADYIRSWKKSADESQRLVAYIRNRKPHLIKSTVSLNETRLLIAELTKPIAEIIKAVQNSITVNKQAVDDLEQVKAKKEDLAKHLYIMKEIPKAYKREMPMTVCTDASCTEIRDGPQNGEKVTHYKTRCHDPCYLTDVKADVIRDSGLIHCTAFSGSDTCRKCQHSWQTHMHFLFDLKFEMNNVINTDTQSKLKAAESDVQRKEILVKEKRDFIKELEGEREEFQRASVDFCIFLKKNSITPYNDATLEYLTYLIQYEKGLVAAGGNPTKLRNLENYKIQYETQVKVIIDGLKSGENASYTPLTQEEVNEKVEHLYSLKNYGKALRDIRATVAQAHSDTYREQSHNVRVRNSSWNYLGRQFSNGFNHGARVRETMSRGWRSFTGWRY